jgi:aerobic C4-dicarboxylate transport protein
VVCGIAGMEDMKSVGKTGGYALLYFEVVSSIALVIGLFIVNIAQPGVGMNVDVTTLDTKGIAQYAAPGKMQTTTEFLLGIIPNSVVDAFAKGDMLQVLFFSILFGYALHAFGERGKPVFKLVEGLSHILFAIVGVIMKVAPIGAFGAMAFTIGKHGLGSLAQLAQLMLAFYLTCLIFVFGVLGTIARVHGFNIWKFIKYIKEELFLVLGTSSSESALPRLIAKMENLGVSKSVVGLVVPTGYSFNLDGTSIYLTMAAVFIAQATNTPMTLTEQITLLAILLLTSKGAAGVTGSGFIVLAATLSAVGTVPVAGLALILGIDRFMSEARALTNFVGNGVATIVVGKWCNALDSKRMTQVLNDETPDEANVPEQVLDEHTAEMDLHAPIKITAHH